MITVISIIMSSINMTEAYKNIEKHFSPLRLIEEVKKHPRLYEPGHPKDRMVRLQLWKEIGSALFPNWGTYNKATMYHTVLQIQRKWRSLRDAYNRELRSRRSGHRTHQRVYIYFKRMSFLGGFDGDISEEDETTNDTLENPLLNELMKPLKSVKPKPQPKTQPKKKRKPKKSSSGSSAPPDEVEMPVFNNVEMPTDMESDTDKLFLLSFLPEMRQLPVNIKMWTRAQIANVMQEAVGCHYNNTQPGSFTAERDFKRQRNESSD